MISDLVLRYGDQRANGNVAFVADCFHLAVGQHDPENSASLWGPFYANFPPVILHDLLNDRESQARTILLAITDEGMEEPVADGVGDAGAIIGHGDMNCSPDLGSGHLYLPIHDRSCLAGIKQEIVQCPLKFSGIEPSGDWAAAQNINRARMMTRMNPSCLYGTLDGLSNVAVSERERFTRAGKCEQGGDEMGDEVHARPQ